MTMMCEVLEVSRSGYYAWEERRPAVQKRERDREALARKIAAIYEESRGTYAEVQGSEGARGRASYCREPTRTGPKMGGRYHLHSDHRRLALSRSDHRPLFAAGRWLTTCARSWS